MGHMKALENKSKQYQKRQNKQDNQNKRQNRNKKKIQRIGEMSCFFENINKIDKPLVTLTKRKGKKTKINKTR